MARGSISPVCRKSLQTHRRALYIAGTTFGNAGDGRSARACMDRIEIHPVRQDLHWIQAPSANDSAFQIRRAPRPAALSRAGLRHRRLHHLLQPASAGGDGQAYGAPAGRVMFVASATQVGYALGLLFFVPLGDLLERRALMKRMFAAVVVALLLVSAAPTLAWLIAASVLLGVVASVTHIVLPIAPELVPHKERGRAIGTVMMGLLLGVLLARPSPDGSATSPRSSSMRRASFPGGPSGSPTAGAMSLSSRRWAMRSFFLCSAA